MARAARPRGISTVCPFLRTVEEDQAHLCLSNPDEPEPVQRTYVSTICSTNRHFTCRRFVRADPSVRKAMVVAASSPSADAEPVANPSGQAVAAAISITSPLSGTHTDESALVVTGMAPAHAAVALLHGPKRVAETEADEHGEWSAIVSMDRPGTYVWTAAILRAEGRPSVVSLPCRIVAAAAPTP